MATSGVQQHACHSSGDVNDLIRLQEINSLVVNPFILSSLYFD
jgi:hypothetical protein